MKNNKPTVSIIMLCYNYAYLVSRALEGCKIQKTRDFELIFVNNASTDNTQQVIENFKKQNEDMNIKIINVENNKGPINGYNIGLQAANGKYIMIHDADDWMEHSCLDLLIDKANRTNADLVACNYQEVTPNNTIKRKRRFPLDFDVWTLNQLQGVIFKTEIIRENNIFFEKDCKSGDLFFIQKFAIYCKSVACIRRVLYNYLINPVSVTKKVDETWNKEELHEWVPLNEVKKILVFTKEIADSTDDENSKRQLCYTAVKNVDEGIILAKRQLDSKTYRDVRKEMLQALENTYPHYKQNRQIRYTHNSRTFLDRVCVKTILEIDKMGMWNIFDKIVEII